MTEREQVIANLLYMKRDCLEGSDTDKTIDRAVKLLKEQETAVPLDKLCEWLAGNAWHLDCSDCDGEYCDCPQLHDDSGSSPEFWKTKLTKWMEEQDADIS